MFQVARSEFYINLRSGTRVLEIFIELMNLEFASSVANLLFEFAAFF